MKFKKAMSGWIWILIILVLIVIGIVIWFMISGDSGSSSLIGGNNIPSPPPLPE